MARSFSVHKWRIKAIDGNMVTVEELLLPDPNGPIVVLDDLVEWIIREQLEDTKSLQWKPRERELIDKAIAAYMRDRSASTGPADL